MEARKEENPEKAKANEKVKVKAKDVVNQKQRMMTHVRKLAGAQVLGGHKLQTVLVPAQEAAAVLHPKKVQAVVAVLQLRKKVQAVVAVLQLAVTQVPVQAVLSLAVRLVKAVNLQVKNLHHKSWI